MTQPTTSSFPSGFPNGLLLQGVPIVQTNPGRVMWVYNGTTSVFNSVGGSDSGGGQNSGTFLRPYRTLSYALTQCTAGRGDIIIIRPGHAETISTATALALSVAGVAIIGLGYGATRPTFTLDTANTATIAVSAAQIAIQNCVFVANFLSIAALFTLTTAKDFVLERCTFKDTTSVLNFVTIVSSTGAANTTDGFTMRACRISSLGTTAATTALKVAAGQDSWTVTDNFGNWAVLNDTAAMLAAGAFNMTNFDFGRNVLQRPNTSSTGGSFISTSGTAWTGHAYDNYMYQLDNTAGIWIATGTGGAFGFTNNFSPITGAVDKSALINPAAV